MRRITLYLTPEEIDKLEILSYHWDEGPSSSGWQSKELESLATKIRTAVKAFTPSVRTHDMCRNNHVELWFPNKQPCPLCAIKADIGQWLAGRLRILLKE